MQPTPEERFVSQANQPPTQPDENNAAETAGDISVRFLAEGEQAPQQVAQELAGFFARAQRSLDIAIYDWRLSAPLAGIVKQALDERARSGVAIRIAYDAGKLETPGIAAGADPAPPGTSDFVQWLGYPSKAITGLKLMHNKYVCLDAGLPEAAVWTGSANFTDDQWTFCDNNILEMRSAALASAYARDFAQLWQTGTIGSSGGFDTPPVTLSYRGQPATLHVDFSPGCGPEIDYLVAHRIAGARRRVRICSMLLNSGALIAALSDLLRAGRVPVDGVYDRTQMQGVFPQWQQVPGNRWKIPAVEYIIEAARLVGKNSTPYTPTSRHDFMHNKVLVVDDTVITGSYNFSHSAEMNAENILFIDSAPLAEQYSAYIDHLKAKYGNGG
jgi:phosphatidylserine/phosphatidylglycerophosphate/cardiolipin synthase-like enzyme